jgi:predicted membrane metal-binding protein
MEGLNISNSAIRNSIFRFFLIVLAACCWAVPLILIEFYGLSWFWLLLYLIFGPLSVLLLLKSALEIEGD